MFNMGSLPTSHNGAWSNKGFRGLCVMPVWGGGGKGLVSGIDWFSYLVLVCAL